MNITIIGAGSFGKALKHILNKANLADIEPDGGYSEKSQHYIHTADLILLAVPSQALKNCLKMIKPLIKDNAKIISCVKALFYRTDMFTPTQLVKRELGLDAATLSGPNLSKEIENNIPTFTIIAGPKWVWDITRQFKTHNFVAVPETDVLGTEFAGATKNLLALTAGIIQGKYGKYSSNMQGAVLALMAEELMLVYKRFSKEKTGTTKEIPQLMFLADTFASATSDLSHNKNCGKEIGRGKEIPKGTIEGCDTLKALYEYVQTKHIDAPLLTELHHIVHRNHNPQRLADILLKFER